MLRDTEEVLQIIASALDQGLNEKGKPKKNGFVVLIFPFDQPEGARTNYISNCAREDIVVALKEVVARFEGQPKQKGKA